MSDVYYDPFTGMPSPVAMPQDRGPSVADAYRMGGLAGMDQYDFPPPRAAFDYMAYDKAQRAQDRFAALPTIPDSKITPDWMDRTITGKPAPSLPQQIAADAVLTIPQSPLDVGLYALGGPYSRLAKIGALAAGAALEPTEAQAGGGSVFRRAGQLGRLFEAPVEGAAAAATNWLPTQYLREPQRVFAPGIYKDPRVIASEAAANVAPEHPALKQLFGVTRDDLWEIGGRGTRQGNMEPQIWMPSKGGTSYAAANVSTPANAQRLVDALSEAERYPQLTRGMDAWYVMDPAFQRMVQLVGYDQAVKDYTRFNAAVPPFSAGSDVLTEINRGTAANMMAARGEYPRFEKYAGIAEDERGRRFPQELADVKGHAYHAIQSDPVARWLATGEHGYGKDTVKIPLYSQASGVPETGFQTRLPVPDAHFTRAIGMSDVRKTQNPGDYMTGAEYRPVGPWFRENVAAPLGIQAVPAQGRMWGTFAPQTGVKTAVGAPKLELLAQSIWERAQRLGIDPAKLRDDVLQGKAHALWALAAPLGIGGAAAGMGGLARQDAYDNSQ